MLDFTQPRSKCTLKNYVPKQIKTGGNCYLSTVRILSYECIYYMI